MKCLTCHRSAHGKPFDLSAAWDAISHPTTQLQATEKPLYKTPLNLAISPDGSELYVACEASDSVIVIDVSSQLKIAEIVVGGQPHDVAIFDPARHLVQEERVSFRGKIRS